MEGTDSSRRRKRLESASSSSLSLTGFGGSDDEDDPHKRKRLPVTKECGEAAVTLLRRIILEILVDTRNETLRKGLQNPDTRRWNRAINDALEERFGHSLQNWRRIAHFLIVANELTIQGDQSAFFLRVLALVKGEDGK